SENPLATFLNQSEPEIQISTAELREAIRSAEIRVWKYPRVRKKRQPNAASASTENQAKVPSYIPVPLKKGQAQKEPNYKIRHDGATQNLIDYLVDFVDLFDSTDEFVPQDSPSAVR